MSEDTVEVTCICGECDVSDMVEVEDILAVLDECDVEGVVTSCERCQRRSLWNHSAYSSGNAECHNCGYSDVEKVKELVSKQEVRQRLEEVDTDD